MIVIQYTTNGNLYRKLYYNNKNQLHNTNGPAQIWYYNNIVKKEDYFINNMAHRENVPAEFYYHENGYIKHIEYKIKNGTHNAYGPARIFYNKEGIPTDAFWYYKNKCYTYKIRKWLINNKLNWQEMNESHYNQIWFDYNEYKICLL